MQKIKFLLIIPVILFMFGCEDIVEFDRGEISVDGVVINALAVCDTTFSASVSKAYPFYRMEAMTGDAFWIYEASQLEQYDKFFKDSAVVDDALVQLIVNDTEQYLMNYDSESLTYRSEYIPKEGDKLRLSVESGVASIAISELKIPYPQNIDIVSWKKEHSVKNNQWMAVESLFDYTGKDTVVRMVLKITDPAEENNFYRLKVRNYAMVKDGFGSVYYKHNDIFTSADVIFKDEQLPVGYRGWPAYFSNVFSDQLFNGREYEFTVESRLREGDEGTNYVVVELQSITRELYNYIKSTMLYRITPQDSYTEPIMIYSNVENGWGIFGGISTDRHVVYL